MHSAAVCHGSAWSTDTVAALAEELRELLRWGTIPGDYDEHRLPPPATAAEARLVDALRVALREVDRRRLSYAEGRELVDEVIRRETGA